MGYAEAHPGDKKASDGIPHKAVCAICKGTRGANHNYSGDCNCKPATTKFTPLRRESTPSAAKFRWRCTKCGSNSGSALIEQAKPQNCESCSGKGTLLHELVLEERICGACGTPIWLIEDDGKRWHDENGRHTCGAVTKTKSTEVKDDAPETDIPF